MCLAVNPWAALAIFVSLLVIQFFTQRYSRRNGLLKGCIIEVENYKKHLLQHKENIVRGREFLNRQPLILALDLSDDFPPNEQIKDFYRLDIIKEIDRKLWKFKDILLQEYPFFTRLYIKVYEIVQIDF